LTCGLFLLVINALMIQLVSALVKGFQVSSFGTAFVASIFISLFSFMLQVFVLAGSSTHEIRMPHSGLWV